MTPLQGTIAILRANGVGYALIGAVAMSVHGVMRATGDLDLLVVDPSCLSPVVWEQLIASGTAVDIRIGDSDDPLAGVVRVDPEGDSPIDLVVGRYSWQAEALKRADLTLEVEGLRLPVVDLADLMLLKLFAGGTQDRWDLTELLALGNKETTQQVEERLAELPTDARSLWKQLVDRD